MIARVGVGLLAAAALAIVLVSMTGGSDFRVELRLPTSSGLRQGSDVKVGGVTVGKVARLDLGRDDLVEVGLSVDPDKARVGAGASVAIRSANLLGQKFVDLQPGDHAAPARSGVVIPASRVTTPVDLDEIYAVLDGGTRARLGVLINEAGTAFTGRKVDLNTLLRGLPAQLDKAADLVAQLNGDNATLRDLVARSDRFVSRINASRGDLTGVVRAAGQTMESLAARRPQLTESLRRAPHTLVTTRRFLDDLRATTVPLGPAARALSAVSPALSSTLGELEPFRRAAAPALREAAAVAPLLGRLGDGATPVVERANPTVASLDRLVDAAPPLTRALDIGVDDVMGFVQGWPRALQTRDGAGHVFRGHFSMGPEFIRGAVGTLLARRRERGRVRVPRPRREQPPVTAPARPGPARPRPQRPASPLDVPKPVDDLLDKLGGTPLLSDDAVLPSLLDYLLRP
jgi:phospholipid/cholesterol/gamma-HCH transport system substrate-binding protein